MKNESKTLVIIDGSYLLFTMFYGVQARLRSLDGVLLNAVLGFVSALNRYVKMFSPTHLLVVFDSEQPNNRNELDAQYKANREVDFSQVSDDENPFCQLPIIQQLLDHINVRYAEIGGGLEADDVIAAYSKNFFDTHKYIVSGDTDMLQLVSDSVTVYVDRGKKSVTYNISAVTAKMGIPPCFVADFKSLTGDKADNISGVYGIGGKTASKLINTYGNIESIINAAHTIQPPSLRQKIEAAREQLRKKKLLISLSGDAPLPFAINQLEVDIITDSGKKATQLLRELGYIN